MLDIADCVAYISNDCQKRNTKLYKLDDFQRRREKRENAKELHRKNLEEILDGALKRLRGFFVRKNFQSLSGLSTLQFRIGA